jgi:hypothetical protein
LTLSKYGSRPPTILTLWSPSWSVTLLHPTDLHQWRSHGTRREHRLPQGQRPRAVSFWGGRRVVAWFSWTGRVLTNAATSACPPGPQRKPPPRNVQGPARCVSQNPPRSRQGGTTRNPDIRRYVDSLLARGA